MKNDRVVDLEQFNRDIDNAINMLQELKSKYNSFYTKDELVVFYRNKGLSYGKIAQILGVSQSAVFQKAKKLGLVEKKEANYDRAD